MSERNIEYSEPIEVDMFEWEKGVDGQTLATTGLGPCVGIAVYDPNTKVGHLMHFPAPVDTYGVDEFLSSIAQDLDNPFRLLVWVRGGSIDMDEDDAYQEMHQAYVIQKLADFGVLEQNLDVEWAKGDDVTDMELNCSTGQFSCNSSSLKFMLESPDLETF